MSESTRVILGYCWPMLPFPYRKAAALLLLGLLAGTSLTSQEPVFRSNVKVVNVLATVREKNGGIMRDLTKEEFVLEEDGRPQTIRYFARETDQPLTIGLLVDTSYSQRNILVEEVAASHAFLNNMLRIDKDQAFLIRFDFDVELLQDTTQSPRALETALDELKLPGSDRTWGRNFQRRRMPGGGRPRNQLGGGGTLLYDAVFLGADEIIAPLPGRKALIVLSDGEDYGSKVTLDDAVRAAQKADAVVYTILFTDSSFRSPIRVLGTHPRGHGKRVLDQMAKATGGRVFEVSSKNTIRQIYAQIEEELRNQYSLGYSSDRPEGTGYRKISVRTTRKDTIVQARDGYYPGRQAR